MPGLHQLPWDKAGSRADTCLLQSSRGGQGSPQPCSQGSPCMLKAEVKRPSHFMGCKRSLPWQPSLLSRAAGGRAQVPASRGLYPGSSFTFKPQGRGGRGGGAVALEGWEHHEPELGFTLELCKQHPGLAFLEDAHVKIKGRYCLGSPGWSQNSLHALLCGFGSSGREGKPSPSAPTPARGAGCGGDRRAVLQAPSCGTSWPAQPHATGCGQSFGHPTSPAGLQCPCRLGEEKPCTTTGNS